jgi:hypothetical protein
MKTNQIITLSILSIVLASCSSAYYNVVTHIDRNGSGWREIQTTTSTTGSITELFPYDLSYGWEIFQTDTLEQYPSGAIKQNVKIGKRFNSIKDLPAGLRSDIIFPIAEESLKKRFRWFYTYYDFVAIYPELSYKGRVPMENYLNKSEQKFYFQGDMSAYEGMNGIELKEELDDIEKRFLKWYNLTMFEENFDIILHYSENDFRSKLPTVKDTLYSILEKQNAEEASMEDISLALDKYFSTNFFTKLFSKNELEMNNMLEERLKIMEALSKYNILYELTLPGKILAANTCLRNDGALKWNVNLYRFLADDYALSAESRKANFWAFAVTLLLVVFSVFCFTRK